MAGQRMGTPQLTPLVVMPLLGRLRCLSSSGTTRFSISRTTTLRQWSKRVSSSHSRGQQWIWPGIWGPPLALTTSCENFQLFFGMVASFDVLMQNFYKVTQSNNEKVSSFATQLEGTCNQIQLQCPRRMTDLEVQQHLMDCLFHGVHKHIHNSF